jgi:hypothetical protein
MMSRLGFSSLVPRTSNAGSFKCECRKVFNLGRLAKSRAARYMDLYSRLAIRRNYDGEQSYV